jgi:hypothetical protein
MADRATGLPFRTVFSLFHFPDTLRNSIIRRKRFHLDYDQEAVVEKAVMVLYSNSEGSGEETVRRPSVEEDQDANLQRTNLENEEQVSPPGNTKSCADVMSLPLRQTGKEGRRKKEGRRRKRVVRVSK